MIRVVIADDHRLVRQGIRSLLEQSGDIMIIGEASDGLEALALAEKLHPEVLVLDIGMPHLSGIQVAEQISVRQLNSRVVILSMHTEPRLVKHALQAGAKGYVLKNSLLDELLLAIRAAERGYTYLSPEITPSLVHRFLSNESGSVALTPYDQLSERERDVLKLLAEGHSNKEIADILHISVRTAQKHRANLMLKLDIHDVPGLTKIAIQNGLVFLNE